MNIKIIFIIAILILLNQNCKAQDINHLDFFPYHVGDLWQKILQYDLEEPKLIETKITSIDTLWDDSTIIVSYNNTFYNSHYKIFLNYPYKIYHMGPYDGRYILYLDLNVKMNSSWLMDSVDHYFGIFVNEFTDWIFGDSFISREYVASHDTVNLLGTTFYIALGIGEYMSEWDGGIEFLTGCIINGVKYGTIVNIKDEDILKERDFYMLSSFPNPFNNQLTINYYLPESTLISLVIYDVLGRKIENLYNGLNTKGNHYHLWQPQNLSSGLYLIVLKTDKKQLTKKILYLK